MLLQKLLLLEFLRLQLDPHLQNLILNSAIHMLFLLLLEELSLVLKQFCFNRRALVGDRQEVLPVLDGLTAHLHQGLLLARSNRLELLQPIFPDVQAPGFTVLLLGFCVFEEELALLLCFLELRH